MTLRPLLAAGLRLRSSASRVRLAASLLVPAVVASLTHATGPALAADEEYPHHPALGRETLVWWVVHGTPSVSRASAAALLGTELEVRDFVENKSAEAFTADQRAAAQALASLEGPSIRTAALQALGGTPEQLTAIMDGGWESAWATDGRVRAYRVREAGGPVTKEAAQAALNGSDDDVADFLADGRSAAAYADDRLAMRSQAARFRNLHDDPARLGSRPR